MDLNVSLSSILLPTTTMFTSTISPWGGKSSFPYSKYKDLMPADQFAKLIAMHDNSFSNAALYVTVVLAVYALLLSLLLWRNVRRGPRELPPLIVPPTVSRVEREGRCSWITKPWRNTVRHCTMRGEVTSVSSDDIEPHPRVSEDRRDSTVIKMTQLQGRGSVVSTELGTSDARKSISVAVEVE